MMRLAIRLRSAKVGFIRAVPILVCASSSDLVGVCFSGQTYPPNDWN